MLDGRISNENRNLNLNLGFVSNDIVSFLDRGRSPRKLQLTPISPCDGLPSLRLPLYQLIFMCILHATLGAVSGEAIVSWSCQTPLRGD